MWRHLLELRMKPTASRLLSHHFVASRLLQRLDRYHNLEHARRQQPLSKSDSRQGVNGANDTLADVAALDVTEYSQNVLRWFSEAAGNNAFTSQVEPRASHRKLLSMVREYTELHKPIAYILGQFILHSSPCIPAETCLSPLLGTQPFGSLDLLVEPPILIPRPETEEWATRLVEVLKSRLSAESRSSKVPYRILDLCSGSGCIGLLLAQELSRASQSRKVEVLAVDVLEQAVALGRKNAERHAIPEATISFLQADLFSDSFIESMTKQAKGPEQPFDGFDLIVSNPPYIPRIEYEQLDASVKDHESPLALLGESPLAANERASKVKRDADGLDFYRRIRDLAPLLLKPTLELEPQPARTRRLPRIVMEVGKGQAEAVAGMFGTADTKPAAKNADAIAFLRAHWTCRIQEDFQGIERSVWYHH